MFNLIVCNYLFLILVKANSMIYLICLDICNVYFSWVNNLLYFLFLFFMHLLSFYAPVSVSWWLNSMGMVEITLCHESPLNWSLFLNVVTDIKETATAVNFTLMKLIALQDRNDHPEVRPNGKFITWLWFVINCFKF